MFQVYHQKNDEKEKSRKKNWKFSFVDFSFESISLVVIESPFTSSNHPSLVFGSSIDYKNNFSTTFNFFRFAYFSSFTLPSSKKRKFCFHVFSRCSCSRLIWDLKNSSIQLVQVLLISLESSLLQMLHMSYFIIQPFFFSPLVYVNNVHDKFYGETSRLKNFTEMESKRLSKCLQCCWVGGDEKTTSNQSEKLKKRIKG